MHLLWLLSVFAAAVAARPQNIVTRDVLQDGPDGCNTTHSEPFAIQLVHDVPIVDINSREEALEAVPDGSKTPAQLSGTESAATSVASDLCRTEDMLSLRLINGILLDGKNRTGYIASNHQFQFDNPPQSGALQVSGFSYCPGDLLGLQSTVWWACDATSYSNLFDAKVEGAACRPVHLRAVKLQECGTPPAREIVTRFGSNPTNVAEQHGSLKTVSPSASKSGIPSSPLPGFVNQGLEWFKSACPLSKSARDIPSDQRPAVEELTDMLAGAIQDMAEDSSYAKTLLKSLGINATCVAELMEGLSSETALGAASGTP